MDSKDRDFELKQLKCALALPDEKRDEELVILFSRISTRIIPAWRWRACPELLSDARALAIENMYEWWHAKKNTLTATRPTIQAFVVIARHAAALTLRRESKHTRHCVPPEAYCCSDEDERDPFTLLVDRSLGKNQTNQEEEWLDHIQRVERLEKLFHDPTPKTMRHLLGALAMVANLLPRLPEYILVNVLLKHIETKIGPLLAEMGLAQAFHVFFDNISGLVGPTIKCAQLRQWAYNRNRKKKTTLSV